MAYIGFIFYEKSPRFIGELAPEFVKDITGLKKVGVFVNESEERILNCVSVYGLDHVQLHGNESVDDARRITRPVWKALTLESPIDAWPADIMVLLDAHDPDRKGGTGRTIDWRRAADVAAQRRVILAGGLKPENVGEAVASVRPHGIDVSSGVEREPGIKDVARLTALFEAVHGSHHQTRS